jgi:drug/metabolite transporter (DMT)-like permease
VGAVYRVYTDHPMSRVQANLLLTVIALIWGSAFVAQSWGMAHLGPMTFTGVRFLIGAGVVLPLVLIEWRRRHGSVTLLRITDFGKVAGLGILLLAGAAMQQIGIVTTSITNAGFLTALYVPLVPLLGWLLWRHWPHPAVWPSALACLVGAYLLSGTQGLSIGRGDLWVIGSSLPWALHVLLVGRVADQLNAPFLVAGGQFLVCGALALLYAWVAEPISLAALHAAGGALLYTGVLSVGVAFTAQVVAQRYAQAADAAIVLSSETLFAAMFGFLLLNERLTWAGMVGCVLIFVSMLAVQLLPLITDGTGKSTSSKT